MEPIRNSTEEGGWQPITEVVFYEPRTIPAGWDVSEFLPTYATNYQDCKKSMEEEDLSE